MLYYRGGENQQTVVEQSSTVLLQIWRGTLHYLHFLFIHLKICPTQFLCETLCGVLIIFGIPCVLSGISINL